MRMQETFTFTEITIAALDLATVTERIKNYPYNTSAHVAFPDASVLAMAQQDPQLKDILNKTWLTLPDGKPLEMVGRRFGFKKVRSISGYWLSRNLLQSELTHYFYGSTPEVLETMKRKFLEVFPDAKILGFKSPPFVDQNDLATDEQIIADLKEINSLSPHLLWVGLSSPKQDYLIHHHLHRLDATICLGIGGVFDYLSGRVEKSPEWVKKLGLRWLWRLLSEPKRLWRKYLQVFQFVAIPFVKAMIRGRV